MFNESEFVSFDIFPLILNSLNKTKRQRELLRITHENFAILKRLTSKEPHYHHMRWQDEWNVSEAWRRPHFVLTDVMV